MDEVVQQALAGDEAAFARLIERHTPGLYHFCRRLGLSNHDAEDVVQETFIKAHGARSRFDPRYAFSTWLFTIGRRLAYSFHRRRQARPEVTTEHPPEPVAPQPAEPEAAAAGLWDQARARLTRREFEALWLRYDQDLSVREIARALEISEVHARVLLHRARSRLAENLQPATVATTGR